MKRFLTAFMPMLFALALSVPAQAEVRVMNTARCIFGSIVMAEKAAGIDISQNSSCAGLDEGVKSVSQGTADVGTLARNLTTSEIRKGLTAIPVTSVGIAIMVNKNNPVKGLTFQQALEIMAGNIKNWKEVGGPDKKILIVNSTCGGSEKNYLKQLFAQSNIEPDYAHLTRATMEVDISDTVVEKIEKFAMAVAVVPPIFHTANTKFLEIDGYPPTRANVLSGQYPLTKPLNLVVKGQPSGDIKKFTDFVTGPKGQALVEKNLAMDWLEEGF